MHNSKQNLVLKAGYALSSINSKVLEEILEDEFGVNGEI